MSHIRAQANRSPATARIEQCEARMFLSVAAKVAADPPAPLPGGEVRVYEPHSTVRGQTMAEWTQDWWKWAWSIPEDPTNNTLPNPVYENPLNDPNGSLAYLGRQDKVFFLGGVYKIITDPATPTVYRTRTIAAPTGMPILFPVLNAASSAARPTRPQTAEGLINLVDNVNMPLAHDAFASLNGVAIQDVASYTEPSGIFEASFPANNIYSVPVDRQNQPWISYSNGYWIMLQPLSPGQYTLHFGGAFGATFALDVTYNITIVPQGLYNKNPYAPWPSPQAEAVKAKSAFSDVKIARNPVLAEDPPSVLG